MKISQNKNIYKFSKFYINIHRSYHTSIKIIFFLYPKINILSHTKPYSIFTFIITNKTYIKHFNQNNKFTLITFNNHSL